MSVRSNMMGGKTVHTVKQKVQYPGAPAAASPAEDAPLGAEILGAGAPPPTGKARFNDLLRQARARNASDLLLIAGQPPTVYVRGEWSPCEHAILTAEAVESCITGIMTPAQQDTLRKAQDLDMAYAVPGVGRYRINVHFQRGTMAAAVRSIPQRVPTFETLGLPEQVLRFADHPSGLVLLTGGTGQGKSTTMAALIDHIHQQRSLHVVTIEDPIEFEFGAGKSLIEQRQIGEDSPTFVSALRHVLRQRPDVILIGEMRDLETISTALTAAETGHLVMASLHTSSAMQTLGRIIDVFPPQQQLQVRAQAAASLRAILCQRLVRDQLNDALAPATEILIANAAVRRAIRDNETHLLYSMMETGRAAGMHTMEQSLAAMVREGRVCEEDALAAAPEVGRLEKLMGRSGAETAGVENRRASSEDVSSMWSV